MRKLFAVFALLAGAAYAQNVTMKYELTELQRTKLELAQQKAITAQIVLNQAQQQQAQTLQALADQAEAVKKENKWPAKTQFNQSTLTFFDPPEEGKK